MVGSKIELNNKSAHAGKDLESQKMADQNVKSWITPGRAALLLGIFLAAGYFMHRMYCDWEDCAVRRRLPGNKSATSDSDNDGSEIGSDNGGSESGSDTGGSASIGVTSGKTPGPWTGPRTKQWTAIFGVRIEQRIANFEQRKVERQAKKGQSMIPFFEELGQKTPRPSPAATETLQSNKVPTARPDMRSIDIPSNGSLESLEGFTYTEAEALAFYKQVMQNPTNISDIFTEDGNEGIKQALLSPEGPLSPKGPLSPGSRVNPLTKILSPREECVSPTQDADDKKDAMSPLEYDIDEQEKILAEFNRMIEDNRKNAALSPVGAPTKSEAWASSEDFFSKYMSLSVGLGGADGQFYKGCRKDINDDKIIGIKRISKWWNTEDFDKNRYKVSNEDYVLHDLEHPNILKGHGCFETENNVWIVMDYCAGSSFELKCLKMYREQCRKDLTPYNQYIKKSFWELLHAINYFQENGMNHRDLHPGNLMTNLEGSVILCDFGEARRTGDTTKKVRAGMYGYSAPEVNRPDLYEDDDDAGNCDMFSFGVLLYEMLTMYHPFPMMKCEESMPMLNTEDVWGKEGEIWKNYVSEGTLYENLDREIIPRIHKGMDLLVGIGWLEGHAADLIKHLIVVDPNVRLTAKEAQEHPYFKQHKDLMKLVKDSNDRYQFPDVNPDEVKIGRRHKFEFLDAIPGEERIKEKGLSLCERVFES